MDDDASEALCPLERCVNARDNLQMLLRDTRQRANELNNYSKVQAEAETLRLKLASVDAILQEQTQRSIEAINGKEIAEANLKQNQSELEFFRRKVGILEEKADDADKHREQANHWRNKYDEMCCLAEKLEANNIDIKSKYEATVKTLGLVGKKTVSYQNQIAELKAAKSDTVQKSKKLDKYSKSAIQLIDLLSSHLNLSKQTKTVRDLLNVFRRDDVRLFFNTEPYKPPSGEGPSTSSQPPEDLEDPQEPSSSPQPPQDDSMLLASGRRLSDSEEEEDEMADDDDVEVRKLESMLTKQVIKQNPELSSKMKELSARKSAPKMVNSNNIKRWPAGIRKPETLDSGGLLNPKRTHSRQVPTCDFDAIANATEARRKALLGKTTAGETSGPAPSGGTIHGKKGKTIREQQAEMMKESVKEKAARMKAEALAGKTEPKTHHRRSSPQRSTPPRTRHRSFMLSERGSDDSGDEEPLQKQDEEEKKLSGSESTQRTLRPRRSSSVYQRSEQDEKEVPKTPKKRNQSVPREPPPTPSRRSSRLSSHVSSEVEKPTPRELRAASRAASRATSRATSRVNSRASSRRPSPTPSTSSTRDERARARSVLREAYEDSTPSNLIADAVRRSRSISARRVMIETEDEMEEEEEELQLTTTTAPKLPKTVEKAPEVMETAGEALKRRLGVPTNLPKKRAAPAPINAGPPLRTRRMEKMKAPMIGKKKAEEESFGDISSSSNESALHVEGPEFDDVPIFDRVPAGADQPSTSGAPEASEVVEPLPEASEEISDASTFCEDAPESFKEPEVQPQETEVIRSLSEASSDSGVVQNLEETSKPDPVVTPEVPVALKPTSEAQPAPKSIEKAPEVKSSLQTRRQNMIDQLGLNLSDSESEGEAEEEKTPSTSSIPAPVKSSVPAKPEESTKAPAEVPGVSKPAPEAPGPAPSTSELSKLVQSAPEASKPAPSDLVVQKPAPEDPEVPKSAPEGPDVSESAPEAPKPAPATFEQSKLVQSAPKVPKPTPLTSEPAKSAQEAPEVQQSSQSAPESSKPLTSASEAPKPAHEHPEPSKPVQEASAVRKSAPSDSDVPQPAPEAQNAPSPAPPALEVPRPAQKASEAPKSVPKAPPTPKSIPPPPRPSQTISSESSTSTTCSSSWTPSNASDDLLSDIISGAHMPKKTAPVAKTPAIRGRKKLEQPAGPAPSKIVKPKEEPEDVKAPVPRVSKRRTPPEPKEEKPEGPQKRPAPSSSSSSGTDGPPAPKRQYTKKVPGVQIIDAIPLSRRRSSSRVALSRAASEEPTSEGQDQKPSSSTKRPGPLIIDVPRRPHGKAIRQEQKVQTTATAKSGGKRVDKNKAHFRQALDLKVGLNELKRQMEEKNIIINDAIPLTPSDAVDVMMEFLRESSPADMWAVLMRQKLDGNVAPLVNTEEQNFLQVSASLIEEDNRLLELFIKRILHEISLRDSIDAKQCGRLVRLFCHAIKFVQHIPAEDSEDSEDVESILNEKRFQWMRSLFLALLYQNPSQFPKAFAYCLISDMSAYCHLLVDELETPTSEIHVAIRILMHREPDQAAVINWLLNSKFQLAYIPQLSPEDIQKACHVAHQQFVKEEGLKTSLFLAKTADNEVLEVVFRILKDHMTLIEKQFLAPKEKQQELKHRTAYSVPTVATKMSVSEAHTFNRVVEWEKMMLLIMIDNPASTHYHQILKALTLISSEIVSFREIVESPDIEQYVDSSGVQPLRESVQHFLELTSEFTNFVLKAPSAPSTSSN